VRRIIEVEAARLAAKNRTAADIEAMRGHLAAKKQAHARNDSHGYVMADIAFHAAVAMASGNSLLADLYRSFCMVFQDFLDALIADRGVNQYQDRIHDGLLAAIADQDPETAARFAMEGLDQFTHDAQAVLG